eukprot:scaffold2036_cov115-Isochrysis_galbana.AAC.8
MQPALATAGSRSRSTRILDQPCTPSYCSTVSSSAGSRFVSMRLGQGEAPLLSRSTRLSMPSASSR